MKKIRDLRNQHSHDSLIREKLDPDPFVQFETWIYAALESEPGEPNAMTLATISKDGRPSTRVVLLRGIEEGGFSFYTNYCSRKARDIEQNNNVALSFYWASLLRQVRIEGVAEKLSADASDKYFRSRPR
jgi:pyridoxamine 5'-phosphate oxidase